MILRSKSWICCEIRLNLESVEFIGKKRNDGINCALIIRIITNDTARVYVSEAIRLDP